jgi:hypothetical protein
MKIKNIEEEQENKDIAMISIRFAIAKFARVNV